MRVFALLVALLIIGIARAWELVGDRDTGIIASIAVLSGHDRSHDGPFTGALPKPATTTELDPVEGVRHIVADAPAAAATSAPPRPGSEPVP